MLFELISLLVITGYVAVQHDVWIAGDHFIHDVFHALQVMKTDVKDSHSPLPCTSSTTSSA